jgi:hypothetical protein
MIGLSHFTMNQKQKQKQKEQWGTSNQQGLSTSSMGMGFRSLKEKIQEAQLDEEAKKLYLPGWKSTKGGWVADFGPAHTRALYTGPEAYYPFLDERKEGRERILQDEMLLSMASDLYSPNQGSQRKSTRQQSTSAYPSDNIARTSHENIFTRRTQSDNSSSSLDAGVIGAGVDDDFSAEDEILTKLQNSVSLKDITGRNI